MKEHLISVLKVDLTTLKNKFNFKDRKFLQLANYFREELWNETRGTFDDLHSKFSAVWNKILAFGGLTFVQYVISFLSLVEIARY